MEKGVRDCRALYHLATMSWMANDCREHVKSGMGGCCESSDVHSSYRVVDQVRSVDVLHGARREECGCLDVAPRVAAADPQGCR